MVKTAINTSGFLVFMSQKFLRYELSRCTQRRAGMVALTSVSRDSSISDHPVWSGNNIAIANCHLRAYETLWLCISNVRG